MPFENSFPTKHFEMSDDIKSSLAEANSYYNNRNIKAIKKEDFLSELLDDLNGLHASGAQVEDMIVVNEENILSLLTKLNVKSRDMIMKVRHRFYGDYIELANFRFTLWLYILFSASGTTISDGDLRCCAMTRDLRAQLMKLKSKNMYYNGIDQSCGLAELDSIENEVQYIKEWSEESRYVNETSEIFAAQQRLGSLNQKQVIPFDLWIREQPMTELLTSGSIGLNNDASEISRVFKKYFNQLEDKTELKVNSKKALLLVPRDELIEAICKDVVNKDRKSTYNVVSARDYNKTRYIVNSDIVTYFQMKYLFETSEKRSKFTHGNVTMYMSALLKNVEFEETYYKAMRTLKRGGVVAGMDYSRFDFQPTFDEIKAAINFSFADSEVKEALIHTLTYNTWLRNIRTGRMTPYKKGVMSGWFLTSWIDSIINIAWFLAAVNKLKLEDRKIDFYVLGDDSLMISEDITYSDVDDIVKVLENSFNLNINVDKTEKGNGTTYLRHVITKDMVNGLPLRSVNSLLTFNEKNASEYVSTHADDFAAVDTTFSALNKLLSRLNTEFNKNYFYEDVMFNKNIKGSRKDKIHWLNGNKLYGGCGYTLGDQGKWEVSISLIRWRGELRGEAFAQGGIRYKKDAFTKVEKKSVGKEILYNSEDYSFTFAVRQKIKWVGHNLVGSRQTITNASERDSLYSLLLYEISKEMNVSFARALDEYRFDRNGVSKLLNKKLGISKSRIKNILDVEAMYEGLGWVVIGLVDRAAKLVLDVSSHYIIMTKKYHTMQFVYKGVSDAYACKV